MPKYHEYVGGELSVYGGRVPEPESVRTKTLGMGEELQLSYPILSAGLVEAQLEQLGVPGITQKLMGIINAHRSMDRRVEPDTYYLLQESPRMPTNIVGRILRRAGITKPSQTVYAVSEADIAARQQSRAVRPLKINPGRPIRISS